MIGLRMPHLFVRAIAGLMLLPFLAAPVTAQERCTRHVYNSSQYPFRIDVEYNFDEPVEWTVQPYSSIAIVYFAQPIGRFYYPPKRINIIYHPLGTNPDRTGELLSSSWELTPSNVVGHDLDICPSIAHDGSTAWANLVLNDPAGGDIIILAH